MTTIEAARDFTSIGTLAGQVQRSVQTIERLCRREGIAPAMRLNHVPYFDAAQCETIMRNLSTRGA